jgi:hypothetical protein
MLPRLFLGWPQATARRPLARLQRQPALGFGQQVGSVRPNSVAPVGQTSAQAA